MLGLPGNVRRSWLLRCPLAIAWREFRACDGQLQVADFSEAFTIRTVLEGAGPRRLMGDSYAEMGALIATSPQGRLLVVREVGRREL